MSFISLLISLFPALTTLASNQAASVADYWVRWNRVGLSFHQLWSQLQGTSLMNWISSFSLRAVTLTLHGRLEDMIASIFLPDLNSGVDWFLPLSLQYFCSLFRPCPFFRLSWKHIWCFVQDLGLFMVYNGYPFIIFSLMKRATIFHFIYKTALSCADIWDVQICRMTIQIFGNHQNEIASSYTFTIKLSLWDHN